MKYTLYPIILLFTASCNKIVVKKEDSKSNNSAAQIIKPAPDIQILKDEGWGGLNSVYLETYTFWVDVTQGDLYNDVYQIKPGHRFLLRTWCPIINVADVPQGADSCSYAWNIKYSDGRYDSKTGRTEYDGMLEVPTFLNGNMAGYIQKTAYDFSISCNSNYPDCYLCPYPNNVAMHLPVAGADIYYLFTDITDLIPNNSGDTNKIVVAPKINFEKKWVEQNYDNNDALLYVDLLKDTSFFDQSALLALNTIAPYNLTYSWVKNKLTFYWNGTGEWSDVNYNGTTARVSNYSFSDENASGTSRTFQIRTGNRYRISSWVQFTINNKEI